jgi:tetratricopeptide (TPR) repeat protein
MAKTYTANPEAYQDYLKGRYWWNKRTEEGFRKGIEYFQQSIAKDPAYALAYSGLADCQSLLSVFGAVPPKEAFPSAKEAAQRALQIDETLAEAHTSLGIIKSSYDWDWSGAEREFERAIALNPSYTDAHNFYGVFFWEMGEPEKAIAEKKRALELDPLSLVTNTFLGAAFYSARQYDQAIEQERKTLELDQNVTTARLFLGSAYVQKLMYKEGIAEFEKMLVIFPGDTRALSLLGHAYAVAGRKAESQKVLDQLNEVSTQKYVPAEFKARIYAGLGDKVRAFDWLEKAYEGRETAIDFRGIGIKTDPAFDPLRSDPRFQDLLRRMNLQP